MPLKGILHPEKGKIEFGKVLSECADLAPMPLIWNIMDNQQTRGKMISASMIGSCPRKAWLELKHDFYLPLEDLYWASFRGSLRHLALARYAEVHKNFVIEKRFAAKVGGIEISGAVDAYDPQNRALLDWKTCKFISPKNLPYGEHLLQVNIYRLLLEANNLPVDSISIVYMDSSGWAEVELSEDGGTIKYYEKGQRKTASLNAFMKPAQKTAEEIAPRVQVLHQAFHNDIEPPAEPSFLCDLNNREKKSYCPVRHLCSNWHEGLQQETENVKDLQMTLY